MKTIVLLLIIALGVIVSLRAKRERSRAETEAVAASTGREALRQSMAREQQRLQNASAARAKAQVAAHTKTATNASPLPRKLSPEAALANNPTLLAETLRCREEAAEWWAGNMFRAVGFSPEQVQQWKQMIVQHEQRRLDLIAAVEAQGLSRSSETFKTLSAENAKLRAAREREILGDLEPQYREYQRLAGTRGMVEWLTRTGVYLDERITGEQIERTTRILDANTREIVRGANSEPSPVIDWAQTTAQLKGVLSPAQIEILQKVSTQYEKIGRASQRVDERTKLLTAQFKSQRGE